MIPIIKIIVIMIKSTVVRMRSGVMRNMKEKMVDLVKMAKRMMLTRMFSTCWSSDVFLSDFHWDFHKNDCSSGYHCCVSFGISMIGVGPVRYKEYGVGRAPAGGNIKRLCTLEKGYFGAGWEYGKNMKGYEEQRWEGGYHEEVCGGISGGAYSSPMNM